MRTAGDVIKIDHAVTTLSLSRSEAAKLLSRWTSQGWLRRVGRGTYVPASLESLASEHVLADPWVLVPALYAPAYIGGWTAAEHWDLTEQIFREIVVLTSQPVRKKHQVRHGAQFILNHTQEEKIFGTKAVWRGNSKALISDVHRTIIDMLNDPALGGGIQHVSDCVTVYLQRSDRDEKTLVAYADRLGNGAIFKRLGFLIEQRSDAAGLVEACQSRISKGNAKLDPSLKCSRLVSRWRLWIPSSWAPAKRP
jgi:predicted transcriptional regulator of viral defense system